MGVSSNLLMIDTHFLGKNSLDKKRGRIGRKSFLWLYLLVIKESKDNAHRLFADIIVGYLGLQSIA